MQWSTILGELVQFVSTILLLGAMKYTIYGSIAEGDITWHFIVYLEASGA